MRLDRYLAQNSPKSDSATEGTAMPPGAFLICPIGMVAPGQWAEIYRLAQARTVEALRPTRYDRALLASTN